MDKDVDESGQPNSEHTLEVPKPFVAARVGEVIQSQRLETVSHDLASPHLSLSTNNITKNNSTNNSGTHNRTFYDDSPQVHNANADSNCAESAQHFISQAQSGHACVSFLHEIVTAYHGTKELNNTTQHSPSGLETLLPMQGEGQVEGSVQSSVIDPEAGDTNLGCLLLGQHDDVMPIRFVFRHCPTELDSDQIQAAWEQTLAEEDCLKAVYSAQLESQIRPVLWIRAEGWPLFNLEQREANWQTLTSMTALLRLSADQICALNGRSDSRSLLESMPQDQAPLANNLPYRLLFVTGSEALSGILLLTQQVVCDAQTLQYVLVRFWRRLQGLPCKLPPWRSSIAPPHEAQASLNYWHGILVKSRFSLLPRDVSKKEAGKPLLNMQASFVSQEQWRLLQQASAVLEVDLETIMLSAFARWLMLTTQSDAALFGVISSRYSPLPVCPPELKPFGANAQTSIGAGEWVKLIGQQLQKLRRIPMVNLKDLAHALHQQESTVAHMLLECVFCFEQIGVKWPEALVPSDRLGNASGQLGIYSMLQLSIDITDERMRLTWWGLAQLISKQQLRTYESGYRKVLFELLSAVLQSDRWLSLETDRKQVIALTLPDSKKVASEQITHAPSGKQSPRPLPLDSTPKHVLRIMQKLVSDDPDACVVRTSKTQLSRLELWLSSALVAQEIFSEHPQFSQGQTHHSIVVMSNDPVMLAILCLAAQMAQLVPLVVSIDARRTLLADTQHKAWHKLGNNWLVTSRTLPEGVPRLEKKVLIDAKELLSRVRRALSRCKALGIDFSISLSQQSIGAKTLPAQEVTVLRAVTQFFAGPLFQAALGGRLEDPVLGYFDPIAIALPLETIVSNSRYWYEQAMWVKSQYSQLEPMTGVCRAMLVGQQLDHAGFWPFFSCFIAGLPLLWVLPDLLLDTPDGGPLPETILRFLFPPIDAYDDPTLALANESSIEQSQAASAICFMSELSFALLATESGHRNRIKQLQSGARIIVLGDGRLNLPQSYPQITFPDMMLVVTEDAAAQVAGNHAGDPYNSAARIPLGFVTPVDRSQTKAIHDNLSLRSILPMHRAFALGNGCESLAYARSTLRIEIDGLWSASTAHRPTGSLLSIPNRGVSESVLRLRWDVAATVIVQERDDPVIEPDDLWFQPQGAWSASCRFWERFVQRHCQSCWTRVRPENLTSGICGARIIPFARFGTVESNNQNIRLFTDQVSWMRLFTAVGRHWGSGVMPRWIEIFGSQSEPFVERALTESMTFTRLAQWTLRLKEPPRVSQTWVELGGDWFAFFRFSFVLRRLGWDWAVPIRTLHQPLGSLALCVKKAEDLSEVIELPTCTKVTQEESAFVSSSDLHMTRYSMALSPYQLGMFRRHSENLPNQLHRLQFNYSGAMRLVDLRASLNRWIALFPALTSYFELTGQGMQQRFMMSSSDRDVADYLHDLVSNNRQSHALESGIKQNRSTLPRWDELVDRALRFQHEPFDTAFAEKFAIEEHSRQMQLQSPPLWRCLVYPKGQGRWSVWLLMNKLLLDQREWLDSVRCLELLLFKAPGTQRNMFWLDPKHWPKYFYAKTISQIAQNRQIEPLAQSTQEEVVRFWQERVHSSALGTVPLLKRQPKSESSIKTVIQPLPQAFSGEDWQQLSRQTAIDRLTVFTWALVSSLMRYAQCAQYRLDLEVPWSPVSNRSDDLLTGQCGIFPAFFHLPEASPLTELPLIKQQLYECLFTPNPETLLVPGDMIFETLYDALYQQSVCFSYLERLPENEELKAMADVEQLRYYRPLELICGGRSSNGYQLKIEAFPSRGRYVFAWSFDDNELDSQVIDRLIQSVDTALQQAFEQLQRLMASGLAQYAFKRVGDSQLYCWTQSALLCPADFGLMNLSLEDWHHFKQKTPVFRSLWQPGGISAWVLERSLKNPRCLIQGSQVVICARRPSIEMSRRLQNLSLLLPELTARWVVFENGAVALVCTRQSPVLYLLPPDETWDPTQAFAQARDRFGFSLPCIFTLHDYNETQMLVRCDYDLRALDPSVVNAALRGLSEGHLRQIKFALRQQWPSLSVSDGGGYENIALSGGSSDKLQAKLPVKSSQFAHERRSYWRKVLAELVNKPQQSSWLPLTQPFDPSVPISKQVRHTVIDAVAHSSKPDELSPRLHGLICAIQTIRHYIVRLWGNHPWVIHLIFTNQSVISQLGLDEFWSEQHRRQFRGWLPLMIGSARSQGGDARYLLDQLKRAGQYTVTGESQLLEWLEWPQEINLSDIALIITDESPEHSIAKDWHHFQLAPLQFQWDSQLPTRIRLSAHAGLALLPSSDQPMVKRPIQVLEAQTKSYTGVKTVVARTFKTKDIFQDPVSENDSIDHQIIVLDITLDHEPEDKTHFAHQLQSFLAKRLGQWLLPDMVRICSDEQSWGEAACIAWVRSIDEKNQLEIEESLTPVLLRADQQIFGLSQSSKMLSRGYRWFDRVGERLPGWYAERVRDLLRPYRLKQDHDISLRAVRNLRQWTQWSDSGRGIGPKFLAHHASTWPLTPDQASWLAMALTSPNHFNTSLLLNIKANTSKETSKEQVLEILKALVLSDPIFRLYFKKQKQSFSDVSDNRYNTLVQAFSSVDESSLINATIKHVDLSSLNHEQLLEGISRVASHWQSHFDLLQAPLIRFIYFSGPPSAQADHLLLLGHRLVTDHSGLCQLASRIDTALETCLNPPSRTWREWVSFLSHQSQLLQQIPVSNANKQLMQNIHELDQMMYQAMIEVNGFPKASLMRAYFKNSIVRRQFLPPIDEEQIVLFHQGEEGIQDARSVMGMAVLGLAIGSWLNLESVVVGQWWPVRQDPRAKHWRGVVGSFEFLFKNPIHLIDDSALATARRLYHEVPETLQATISEALSRETFDEQSAFSLFSFERIDGQLQMPNFDHFIALTNASSLSVEPENRRRSLIRVEAVFTKGQFSLMWVYDSKVLSVSKMESLVTHFAYYWQMLCQELEALKVSASEKKAVLAQKEELLNEQKQLHRADQLDLNQKSTQTQPLLDTASDPVHSASSKPACLDPASPPSERKPLALRPNRPFDPNQKKPTVDARLDTPVDSPKANQEETL